MSGNYTQFELVLSRQVCPLLRRVIFTICVTLLLEESFEIQSDLFISLSLSLPFDLPVCVCLSPILKV